MSTEENKLPTIGAAMMIAQLPDYAEWLISGQRDLEIQNGLIPNVLDGDWGPSIKEAKSILDGYTGRMGIHGPFISLTLAPRDQWVREYVIKRLTQALNFAGELGATHMVIHSPFEYFGDAHTVYAHPDRLNEVIDLTKTVIDPILPVAEQNNCTMVIETIKDIHTGPLLALIRSFDSPFVRLSIDTGHAYIGHRQGGATPDTWVDAAGPLLQHLHIQDTDGLLDRHWAPGDGSINWYALFAALGKLEHQPRLILEMKDKAWIKRGFDWLVGEGLVK